MGNSEFYSNSTNVTSNGVDYYLSRTPCSADVSLNYIETCLKLTLNKTKL